MRADSHKPFQCTSMIATSTARCSRNGRYSFNPWIDSSEPTGVREERRTRASAPGSWVSISSQVRLNGSSARDLDEAIGALIEVEVEHQPRVGTDAVAEGTQELRHLADNAIVRPAIEKARHGSEAGAELGPARHEIARIGLERLEAALDHGAAELRNVVETA